ncbi:MAG: amidohydrolase family protein [Myxococcota bacterium]
MDANDMILVSVDDHVVEPPTMFDQHLPEKWKARAPRVVRKPNGTDVWLFEGDQLPNIGLNAVVGRRPEEYGVEPTSYDQMRPGCFDIHERIRDMNVNGVLASMCFPSFPAFCGQLWARQPDKELARVMSQAYNDWHVDEWCGSYPGRFIPLGVPQIWDPQLMAEEVRRLAKKGCHAVTFTDNPTKLGLPSLHDEHWNPFWEACCDEGTVICIHIGSSSGMVFTSMDSPVDVMIHTTPISIVSCAADLLWSPVLRKYPDLKFALSEGGIGWVPYFLERADYVYEHHKYWTNQDFGDLKPSDVFRRNIVTCFIDDVAGVKNRHDVGIDTITWECDYPHSDTTWPNAPERLWKSLEGVPEAEIHQMTHENAIKFFQLDSFSHRSKEKCTAGALRAESPDVDLSLKSAGGKPAREGGGHVTSQDITQQLAQAFAEPLPDA